MRTGTTDFVSNSRIMGSWLLIIVAEIYMETSSYLS